MEKDLRQYVLETIVGAGALSILDVLERFVSEAGLLYPALRDLQSSHAIDINGNEKDVQEFMAQLEKLENSDNGPQELIDYMSQHVQQLEGIELSASKSGYRRVSAEYERV